MKKRLLSAVLTLCLLLSLLPVNVLAAGNLAHTPYAVEGGNIYFDPSTGEITGADQTITAADIPAAINGVQVKGIAGRAFGHAIAAGLACQQLRRVTLPEGLTAIGHEAFAMCIALEEISIPSTVTSIGDTAFLECYKLTEITLPQGLTKLENGAFIRCTGLKQISVPGSVGELRHAMFSGCSSLEEVWLGEGITRIWTNTFSSNASLKTVHIPRSVKAIDAGAFSDGCDSLSDVYYGGTAGEGDSLIHRKNMN